MYLHDILLLCNIVNTLNLQCKVAERRNTLFALVFYMISKFIKLKVHCQILAGIVLRKYATVNVT